MLRSKYCTAIPVYPLAHRTDIRYGHEVGSAARLVGEHESARSRGVEAAPSPAILRELAGRVAPVSLARDQLLPVSPGVSAIVSGLRRGSTVSITSSSSGAGATSLALSLLAGPVTAGSWAAIVGMPDLGLVAAAELGVDLDRLAVVPAPGPLWPTVVAALIDAIDVVLLRPPVRVRPADARRLAARVRDRRGVLVIAGSWPEATDVRLEVVRSAWSGLERGHGHLQHRSLEVVTGGRGAASRQRRVTVEL